MPHNGLAKQTNLLELNLLARKALILPSGLLSSRIWLLISSCLSTVTLRTGWWRQKIKSMDHIMTPRPKGQPWCHQHHRNPTKSHGITRIQNQVILLFLLVTTSLILLAPKCFTKLARRRKIPHCCPKEWKYSSTMDLSALSKPSLGNSQNLLEPSAPISYPPVTTRLS
jgi:hypothetical protein